MVRFAGKATGSGLPKENNIAAPSSQYHIAQYIYYNVDIAEDIAICCNMLQYVSAFSPHYEGSIEFNTVNIHLAVFLGMHWQQG